jgi:alginate O-acetyltransferase complex protein AlgI
MSFTSFGFILFLAVVLLVRSQIRSCVVEKWFLLLASYFFYMTWSVPLIVVILLISIVDYQIVRKLEVTEDHDLRRRMLVVSLITNVGLLVIFKYTDFILDNIVLSLNALGFHVKGFHFDNAMPPGISFFTFASISYVVDIYYEGFAPSRSALDHFLFIAYFPKLLAGPIARARNFLPQLRERVRANAYDLETGSVYFLVGAMKKLVVSDQIASHVGLIFAAPTNYDGLTLLQGALGYAVQIYCDFSGYSDMAFGCARMMGFHLPQNFRFPYSASSVSEFWRRWHVTLSEWFRDYVFLPLEVATRSNRNATARASTNLMITFLLCGLWHGAGWTFVIWGGIHGLALAINQVWIRWESLARFLKGHRLYQSLWNVTSHALTLGVVLFAWIFFRAASVADAVTYISRLLLWKPDGTRLLSPYIIPAIAGVVAAHLVVNKNRNWIEELPQRPIPIRIVAYSSLLILVVCFAASDAVPFIYFQF